MMGAWVTVKPVAQMDMTSGLLLQGSDESAQGQKEKKKSQLTAQDNASQSSTQDNDTQYGLHVSHYNVSHPEGLKPRTAINADRSCVRVRLNKSNRFRES